jgi:L-ascorbate metabolism protein UlaG (beta-lactamase superfamily)
MATVRITFVGHATTLIEGGGTRLLTDPVLRDRILHIRRRVDPPAAESYRSIDAVLLSHLHADHFDPASLRWLDGTPRVLAPVGAGARLGRLGFSAVTELRRDQAVEVGAANVRAVDAVHDGRRIPVGSSADAIGFVIEVDGLSIYFAGDTAPFEDVRAVIGEVDVALVPIAGWGPNLPSADHLNPLTAAELVAALEPRVAIPIHWGTLLRIGLDPDHRAMREPADEFAANLARLAPSVEPRVLAPGESTELSP